MGLTPLDEVKLADEGVIGDDDGGSKLQEANNREANNNTYVLLPPAKPTLPVDTGKDNE